MISLILNICIRLKNQIMIVLAIFSAPRRRGGGGTITGDGPTKTPLRCLVCGESFRERHHLTRHMNAHRNNAREQQQLEQQQQQQQRQQAIFQSFLGQK